MYFFPVNMKPLSQRFTIKICPAGYAFAIWGLIYTWQAAIIVVIVASLWMRDGGQNSKCDRMKLFSKAFLLPYGWPPVLGALWLQLLKLAGTSNDSRWLHAMFVTSVLLSACLIASLRGACADVSAARSALSPRSVCLLLRCLVLNGLALYATWALVALLLSTNIWVAYGLDLGNTCAVGGAVQALLAGCMLAYLCADLNCGSGSDGGEMKFLVTPYLTFVWATAAQLVRMQALYPTKEDWNTRIAAATLFMAALMLMYKIMALIRHSCKVSEMSVQSTPLPVYEKSADA